MYQKKPYRKFQRRGPALSLEKKVEMFVLRNSDNGFFTKVSTIPYKFEIPEDRAWDIVVELLSDGNVESIHDKFSGEMKLCKTGRTYAIMDAEQKRKRQGSGKGDARPFKKSSPPKTSSKGRGDENLPAQCHPVTRPKLKRGGAKGGTAKVTRNPVRKETG